MSQTRDFPMMEDQYELLEIVGTGVSATVWRAFCHLLKVEVAVKILDLERQDPSALEEIRRETQTMRMLSHPNLVQIHCSFVSGQSLWLVMPYLSGGSCYHLLKWQHEKGFDEATIATILREVIQALEYCHRNGLIHRDVKAGNMLVDGDGSVKLADFGVSASSWGAMGGDQRHKTFVGTPCWMAPEVMDQEQQSGYDSSADIWSLGITILELAHGHAPFAKHSPLKVLLMTLQEPPPTLKDEGGKHFSRSLRELVACCLTKDPTKRPSAAKLLEHKFLKDHAKKKDYIAQTMLQGQPSLGERINEMKKREAARRAGRGGDAEAQEKLNQMEYVRGVSAWDFDVAQLKAEARKEELPPVPEGQEMLVCSDETEGGGGEGGLGGGMPPLPGRIAAQAPASSSIPSPDSNTQSPDPAKRVPKHRGRFDVYEEEENSLMKPTGVHTKVQQLAAQIGGSTAPNSPVIAKLQAQHGGGGSQSQLTSSLSIPIEVDPSLSGGASVSMLSPTSSNPVGVTLPCGVAGEKKDPNRKGRFSVVVEEAKVEIKPQAENIKSALSRAQSMKDGPKTEAEKASLARSHSKDQELAAADPLARWGIGNIEENSIMHALPQLVPQLQSLQIQQAAQQDAIDTIVKQIVALPASAGEVLETPSSPVGQLHVGGGRGVMTDMSPSGQTRAAEMVTSLCDVQMGLNQLMEDNRKLTQQNHELKLKLQEQEQEIQALRQGGNS